MHLQPRAIERGLHCNVIFQNSPKPTCNGIANQGTPRGSPGAFLAPPPPKGPPWSPWAFVGAGATIFVSATYFTTTRKLELGKPSQGPPGRSWNPWRTPWDPLGVCRCWGYNFRLGNLFYYYEKTWIRETLPGSPGVFLEPLKDPLGPPRRL